MEVNQVETFAELGFTHGIVHRSGPDYDAGPLRELVPGGTTGTRDSWMFHIYRVRP